MHVRLVILSVLLSLIDTAATAQTERPLEIGAQFTGLSVHPLERNQLSLGTRASYDLRFKKLAIAPELEWNYFPQASGTLSDTQLLVGARVGIKIDDFGFFLKARPGLVHFGGSSTNMAIDVGGVFEYYSSQRVTLRFDWGDTLIRFPQPVFTAAAGWHHNPQRGFGVSFRF
ncbi:MAG TPA: hypothetical protein VKZ53_25955 [Candidatus Angelobacter sp.]|nr:hypothetical protein [Candidatus Angelobacter sp.]